MKKAVFFKFLILLTITTYSQDIVIKPEGVEPVIVSVDSMSASDIYNKIKLYVYQTYNYPEKTIVADADAKLIRFYIHDRMSTKGTLGNIFDYNAFCTIEFKNNRYRIQFTEIAVDDHFYKTPYPFFNKKGQLKKMKSAKSVYDNFLLLFTKVEKNIRDYIVNKDDW